MKKIIIASKWRTRSSRYWAGAVANKPRHNWSKKQRRGPDVPSTLKIIHEFNNG